MIKQVVVQVKYTHPPPRGANGKPEGIGLLGKKALPRGSGAQKYAVSYRIIQEKYKPLTNICIADSQDYFARKGDLQDV